MEAVEFDSVRASMRRAIEKLLAVGRQKNKEANPK